MQKSTGNAPISCHVWLCREPTPELKFAVIPSLNSTKLGDKMRSTIYLAPTPTIEKGACITDHIAVGTVPAPVLAAQNNVETK